MDKNLTEPQQIAAKQKKTFIDPELNVFGDIAELTMGYRDGRRLDSVFPVNILAPKVNVS